MAEVLAVEADLLGDHTDFYQRVYPPQPPPDLGTTPRQSELHPRPSGRPWIVFGAFNAHLPSWFSRTGDDRATTRGEAFDGAINSSLLAVANQDLPTHLPP